MNCSRNKIDIVSSAQVKQICYSNFSMRDKELLETKVFFCYFSSKDSDSNKNVIVLLSHLLHAKVILIIFYAFFIERELFFFEIISGYIAYTCEYSKNIVQHTVFFCSSTWIKFSG